MNRRQLLASAAGLVVAKAVPMPFSPADYVDTEYVPVGPIHSLPFEAPLQSTALYYDGTKWALLP